jgi:AcrR family transcriptional regulator
MSSEPLPPIWARPEPRGRGQRPALSRKQIVDAALLIADEEGLEAVSMRRLARELRSGAMSIYHYFQSREELLDLMGDTIGGEMLLEAVPEDWRVALRAIAHHSRAAFKRHPWLLLTLQERPRVSPNMLRHVEQSMAAVASLDLDARDTMLVLSAVDDYVIGHMTRALARRSIEDQLGADGQDWVEAMTPWIESMLESGSFPNVARVFREGEGFDAMLIDSFEPGLELVLDGIERRFGPTRNTPNGDRGRG